MTRAETDQVTSLSSLVVLLPGYVCEDSLINAVTFVEFLWEGTRRRATSHPVLWRRKPRLACDSLNNLPQWLLPGTSAS